jgi:hypothetical protein
MVGLLLVSPLAMLWLVFALERVERRLDAVQKFAEGDPVRRSVD